MKAFGVRLAAGAVTILLGAIMAAQAQKDQQASTDSAWTEEQIPPGKAITPIPTTAALQTADPMDIRSLKPIGEEGWDDDSESTENVQLVQHTESAGAVSTGAMSLPTIPDDLSESTEANSPATGRSVMKMRLPSFGDVAPPQEPPNKPAGQTSPASTGGPSFAIGMPIADAPATAFPDQPKMSEITFADSPGAVATGTSQADQIGVAEHSELPSNDLRGVFAGDVAESSDPSEFAADDPAQLQGGFGPGANLADSFDPSAGVPAAMLTPVVDGGPEPQPELTAAPAATMRIHRESASNLEMGAARLGMQAEMTQPTIVEATNGPRTAMPNITSQPQIVGNTLPSGDETQPYNQPAVATNDQGYAQPAGGFGVPENYPSPGAAAEPAPQLPSPSLPTPSFDTPAFPSQPQYGRQAALPTTQPSATQPNAQGATFPNHAMGSTGSIYQGAGYKQAGSDRPLPAGPTMASPGERYLDGPQSPSVVIHKRAPAEVKVGKPASFVITVKNVGGSKALDVQVHDRVPTGMTLTDATPRPNPKYQPELFWELGDLEPNQERTITLQLTPEQEGELGSVARVTFQAAASVRTISTRPELKIVQKAPPHVGIGQQLEIELEVSNPGTGEATGVILQEDVPAGLEHPQGKQLDNLIGTLGPGEIRRQILRMRAVKPGIVQNQIRVKADDGLETTHTIAVEVIAPELHVSLTGPSRRFLERQATYNLEISNVGTDDATNVELSVQLDRGFTFVKTDFEGQYDSTRHAVFWSLPALPVGQSGKVPLTLLPVEEGNRVLRTEATADLGIKTMAESQVEVASLAELTFSINDTADPIEIGGETIYEIRISNTGSRDDTNVKVALQLPPGLQLVEQGDFTPQGQGIIAFSPRALLKANDEMVYRVKAQGIAAGRHLVKAIVTSDQSNVPVTKEESIMVYADR